MALLGADLSNSSELISEVDKRYWAGLADGGAAETELFINSLARRIGVALNSKDFAEESEVPTQFSPQNEEWEDDGLVDSIENAYWATPILALPIMPNDRHYSCAMDIEAGVLAQGILDGNWRIEANVPNHELLELVRMGNVSMREMLEGNTRLALYWASRYARGDHDLAQDLFQLAFEGLYRAIEGWDALRGYAFSTYATWHIRQRIQRGLMTSASKTPVHIPVHVLEAQSANNRSGGQPSASEILAYRWQVERVSWEQIQDEVPDLISLLDMNPIEELDDRLSIARTIGQCLSFLQERDAEILIRRYGLLDEAETLDAIGQDYGISRERIRQIEVKAFNKLRLHIASLESVYPAIEKYLINIDPDLADKARIVLHAKCTSERQIARTLKISQGAARGVCAAISDALMAVAPAYSDLPFIWITPSYNDPLMRRLSNYEPALSISSSTGTFA